MSIIYIFIILITSPAYLFCQDTTDVFRLKNMDYMKIANSVDCEDNSGTSLEEKICLNKQFQQVDSLMNYNFKLLLTITNDEEKKQEIIENHSKWLIQRRKKSEDDSEGFRGHTFGIIYLQTMIDETNIKIEEIKNQVEKN